MAHFGIGVNFMEVHNNRFTTLRHIGKDEFWLHEWIKQNPSRLGLGKINIKASEVNHYGMKGGRLDILAYRDDIDTYYEIEVMLGECDADHGFRTLDYWARERLRNSNARHVAVLIAEDLGGRYKTVVETLAQFLPFIGIELKTILVGSEPEIATIIATIVSQPDDLVIEAVDEPIKDPSKILRDEEWWKSNSSEAYLKSVKELFRICNEQIGESRIDYTAQSYISLKKGRRCWLPMWPRKDGTYVYIPGGANGQADQPSDFFTVVRNRLLPLNIDPSWTFNYNAGANPIGFSISSQLVSHSQILEILREAYQLA